MKQILLSLVLLGAIAQAQAGFSCQAFLQENKYPLATIVAAGVLYGAYRLYTYMNAPSAEVSARIKDKIKQRFKASFVEYLDHTLRSYDFAGDIARLKQHKGTLVQDALKWLPSRILGGDIVAKRKKLGSEFNADYVTWPTEKEAAFNELFDDIVQVLGLQVK